MNAVTNVELSRQLKGKGNITLVHISDLHFSEGTDSDSPDHRHSIAHLQGIQRHLDHLQFDRLIVSGDITNDGDKESFLRARGWLLNELEVGGGETTGLKLPPHSVGLVPGNHDAWNKHPLGSPVQIWQKSLENYNRVFVEHTFKDQPCCYDWLERDGWGVFIAYVDSCFLGDPEIEDRVPGTRLFDAIAKGKLSIEQSHRLLNWFDQGVRGLLPYPHKTTTIPKDLFADSLKICVMHHYIFEPPARKDEYLMQVSHRDVVFRNIAMADFDVLLCGHKHIADFHTYSYKDGFDRIANERYLLNYFRRIIGAHSLPLRYTDVEGKSFSYYLSTLINLIVVDLLRMKRKDRKDALDELVNLLRQALDNPDVLPYVRSSNYRGLESIDPEELLEIRRRISLLSKDERQQLEEVAGKLKKVIKQLSHRPFLQIMCGSSAKRTSSPDKDRSFNVYVISKTPTGYTFTSERFIWDGDSFSDKPLPHQQKFETYRRPVL